MRHATRVGAHGVARPINLNQLQPAACGWARRMVGAGSGPVSTAQTDTANRERLGSLTLCPDAGRRVQHDTAARAGPEAPHGAGRGAGACRGRRLSRHLRCADTHAGHVPCGPWMKTYVG
eukprot:3342760-Prymnesium_polylepis.2